MDCKSTRIPYRQTGAFSKIALDYIDQAPALKSFFSHTPAIQGFQKAIDDRKKIITNREVLVQELKKQYEGIETSKKVSENIEALLSNNTFTITTAHQNNIFTGPLYYIYKILHAVKLAEHLKNSLPAYNFVPVFYIGSEDADLDELNHIHLGGEKLVWATKQTGAVGRMKIDKELRNLIAQMEGQLSVFPAGNEILDKLKEFYKEGTTLKEATFKFVNFLFAEYGLVILLPDNAAFKKQMLEIFKDDLLNQTASGIVAGADTKLQAAGYKVQAHPREINLFYLYEDVRERFEKIKNEWKVVNNKNKFTKDELLKELETYPERFSPNVILRGLYQEIILPNLAFIGGGGETAYWLQLKELFAHYKIPFPILVLRNSFLVFEKKWQEKIAKLGFAVDDFFLSEQELVKMFVAKESNNSTKLNGAFSEVEQLYNVFKKQAAAVDVTLEKHVDALKSNTLSRLNELEKKMFRAEKRKFTEQQRQIHTIKENLFPGNGLQERTENICYYYARWGCGFINLLYQHSLTLEQEFVLLQEQ